MALLLALLLLQPAASPRAEAERLFTLGTELIAEGDTSGAVAAWEGARATGLTSAAVEHNLGTVALRRGDVGRARLHLERAARLDPLDDAVAQNLRLARDAAGVPARSAAERLWDRTVGVVGAFGLVVLALAFVFGALGLFFLDRRRWALGVGVGALLAVGVASAVLWERSRPVGVVLADEAEVTEEPSAASVGVARVQAGETVEVGETQSGWRRVETDGGEGWLPERTVERL